MVLMLQLLCFMKVMVLISPGVNILLIVMVVMFVLNGIHYLNGWNTVQVLIKHFASLVVCSVIEVIIRKPLYPMVFKTGKVPWRSPMHISPPLHTRVP